jgi:hypothetical protein
VSGNILSNKRAIVHSTDLLEHRFQPLEEELPATLQELIERQMKSCAWATGRMSYQGFSPQLAISIIEGTAIAVSNGSPKDDMGTAAFHIEDSEEGDQVLIEGVLQVPGSPRESSSHRSELGGLYGTVTAVEAVIQFLNITEGVIEVGCDGESALQAFDLEYYFDPQQADFDILKSIQEQIRDSPI